MFLSVSIKMASEGGIKEPDDKIDKESQDKSWVDKMFDNNKLDEAPGAENESTITKPIIKSSPTRQNNENHKGNVVSDSFMNIPKDKKARRSKTRQIRRKKVGKTSFEKSPGDSEVSSITSSLLSISSTIRRSIMSFASGIKEAIVPDSNPEEKVENKVVNELEKVEDNTVKAIVKVEKTDPMPLAEDTVLNLLSREIKPNSSPSMFPNYHRTRSSIVESTGDSRKFKDLGTLMVKFPSEPEIVLVPGKINVSKRKRKKINKTDSQWESDSSDSTPSEEKVVIIKSKPTKGNKDWSPPPTPPLRKKKPKYEVKSFGRYSNFKDRFSLIQNLEAMSSVISSEAGLPNAGESWLRKYSASEDENEVPEWKALSALRYAKRDPLYEAFTPYWISLIVSGRMPFTFSRDKHSGLMYCSFHSYSYWIFSFTSLLLFSTFILFLDSLLNIYNINTTKATEYEQLEKVLLNKHWMTAAVFSCTFGVAVLNSFCIMFGCDEMVSYINDYSNKFRLLGYTVKEGVYYISVVHNGLPLLDLILLGLMNLNNTLDFDESTTFLAICFSHSFNGRRSIEFLNSTKMTTIKFFCVLFQVYVMFCARNLIFLIMMYCQSLNEVLTDWACRLGFLLQISYPESKLDSEKQLRQRRQEEARLATTLNFEKPRREQRKLFRDHNFITHLIYSLNKSFSGAILAYFIGQIASIVYEIFKLVNAIEYHQDRYNIEHVSIYSRLHFHGTNITYQQSNYTRLAVAIYYIIGSFIGFFSFSYIAAKVGQKLMSCFEYIRRFGVMEGEDSHTKRFILSLVMKYHPKRKCMAGVYRFFDIDKTFMLKAFMTFMILFAILSTINRRVPTEIPILFHCKSNQRKICVDRVQVRDTAEINKVFRINQNVMKSFKMKATMPASTNFTEGTSSSEIVFTTAQDEITTIKTTTTDDITETSENIETIATTSEETTI